MTGWTVDYGDGPRPVTLPHAWRQDVPVSWEGPAVYRCPLSVSSSDLWLVFDGVSYRAEVFVDGSPVCDHRGIWDAFAVPLGGFSGRSVDVEVRVTKNGGESFPIRDVLSGFLPYVFHTFGGLYGGARLVRSSSDPTLIADRAVGPSRVLVDGTRLFVDGRPFYLRGVLSWGWYPELGHPNPSDEEIRREVRLARSMGFNTIKLCLWVPRHRFFEVLSEEGMFAWLELPLWNPTGDRALQSQMALELERIVRQYRHHDCIVAWTIGCELGASTSAEYRRSLVEMVERETGCPLVKDNSGGAEMYGGDLREYGTFDDFHPYCDTHFYPVVFDSLLHRARRKRPILLGEFNDFDLHRDLARLRDDAYWVSSEPTLNDIGVRWQHDLPRVVRESRFAYCDAASLMRSSKNKGAWVRRRVTEHVRARSDIAGYVVTGWRHTPISTSGMVDDELRPALDDYGWNSDATLFLISVRRPPWVHGGNRPGWLDPLCFFEGQSFFRIGVALDEDETSELCWSTGYDDGCCEQVLARVLEPIEVGQISTELSPGEHWLEVSFAGIEARWPVWVVPRPDWKCREGWSKRDPFGAFGDVDLPGGDNLLTTVLDDGALDHARVVAVLDREGTVPVPFWRECAFEFAPGLLDPFADKWDRLFSIATDRALDPKWLRDTIGDYETLMNRVDMRTYSEHPYMVRKDNVIVTSLRPQGGHGAQPHGVSSNPSGAALLARLLSEW